ncbi:hypothetical protein PPTG_24158 [Phytophthora nicotianae INRA-310]|uniref:Uncharacterized protein n=1 Tax=Phytophthora nicotianae (strain INRA-310) TaxID=761204 RepID=W2PJD9_PHYN3|nr:hypothetical protein PPTG_24158 [Phytophthora nicotianae INRA-310]ETN00977.1 hypothetical protein PPTG_24158 [Phytophthora nicotianae INRA-310]
MPKSWKDGLRVWRGVCKYNSYEELKMSSDTKVREIQGQERYSLAKGTPESQDTKDDSYVTQHAEWFKPKTAASGGITVGGKSQIPIEAVDMVQILICDSKWTERTLVLHNGHLAPK